MPTVRYPAVLKAVYLEAARLINGRSIPTEILSAPRTVFRYFSRDYVNLRTDGVFPKHLANQALVIRDSIGTNRFSGAPGVAGVPEWGGLYCSTQQQAQINELLHYARKETVNPEMVKRGMATPMKLPRDEHGFPHTGASLNLKCIVQIRIMGAFTAADLSPHNPGARHFLEKVGSATPVQEALRAAARPSRYLWDHMCDGDDCSVARGIGLAVANSDYMSALEASTVRGSARSSEETGDNIVFFGKDGQNIPNLYIEKAYLFPIAGPAMEVPVEF
jgi:hypothetical protein